MTDPAEIRAYYEQTTDRMRLVLEELARTPTVKRSNPELESALGWAPLSVRGTASGSTRRVGRDAFDGRTPYHWRDAASSPRGRFESWMDNLQADTIRAAAEALHV